jgi:hypothetical protein
MTAPGSNAAAAPATRFDLYHSGLSVMLFSDRRWEK